MAEIDDLSQVVKDLMDVVKRQEDHIAKQDRITAEQKQIIAKQGKRIAELESTVEHLQDANRRLLRWRFGPRTEKSTEMDERQLTLEIEGLSSDLVFDHENAGDPPKVIPMRIQVPRRKRGLWSQLCPHLRVEEVYEDLPADQLVDHDGTPLVKAGTERSEELVYEPGHCFIRRTIRQRYGRSDTGEKVSIAPVADKIVPRGGLSDETITAAVVHHAMDCLPYQRIAEMISRIAGTTINRSLITESCNAYAALAEPLLDAMWEQISSTDVLHIDGSFLFHQDGKQPRKCSRKPLYAITDGQQVVMRWRDDEKYQSASDIIPGYQGYVARDEWAGWKSLNNINIIHVGCHAHARRYFAEVQDTDQDARQIISWYQQIYDIERQANESGYTGQQLYDLRLNLRNRYTKPILDQLFDFAQQKQHTRTGAFKRHLQYILRHRDTLTVFLNDGVVPPDNNTAERVLRRNAMLRKNRLFYVGAECGQHIGTLLSLMVSCRELDVQPHHYLNWSLPALLGYRNGETVDLKKWTPLAYAKLQKVTQTAA